MSLMIKGMDMLKYNGEHKEFDRYGCYLTVYKNGKVKLHICDTDYDVVEVSTPHGRLIDADILINDLQGLRKLFPSTGMDYIGGVISLVQNTPAIIEAED